MIPDEPIVVEAEVTGSQRWEPKNYDGKYEGPMRLRTALAKSKNMVSIRILKAIGPKYAQDYVTRFGFEADKHPPYLTMALGAGSVTVWQMARAYSVFANSGYLIQPYYIQKIVDDRGNNLGVANPQHAGDESLRVVDARNAFIMDSMLQDVTRYGTAARASKLGRKDLAGKTGTTNDFLDAWFCGYSPALVGIAWVGFDQPRTLGRNETGGSVALPIWIGYMEKALKGVPENCTLGPGRRGQFQGRLRRQRRSPGILLQGIAAAAAPAPAGTRARASPATRRDARIQAASVDGQARGAGPRLRPRRRSGRKASGAPGSRRRRSGHRPGGRARRKARRRRACRPTGGRHSGSEIRRTSPPPRFRAPRFGG